MKRRVLTIALIIAVVGGLAWLIFSSPPEPRYEGKPLSFWLEHISYGVSSKQQQAEQAVREIGANAVPTLLHMLRQKDSPLKPKLIALAKKQHFIAIHDTSPENRNIQASSAFRVLGTNAALAVPQLLKIFDNPPYPYSRQVIPQVLGGIGPPAEPAVPTLLRALADTNPFIRNNAAAALGSIHARPAQVVPALIKCLEDPDAPVRGNAAKSLGAYGLDAQAAIPALKQLILDERSKATNPPTQSMTYDYGVVFYQTVGGPVGGAGMAAFDVRSLAEKALKQIDPEAAKAAIK